MMQFDQPNIVVANSAMLNHLNISNTEMLFSHKVGCQPALQLSSIEGASWVQKNTRYTAKISSY
jgi:hypothetical protein